MDRKLVALIFVLVALVVQNVLAVFMYNRPMPTENELGDLDLQCIPGRTVLQYGEEEGTDSPNKGSHLDNDKRRSHMNTPKNKREGRCKVCVCSAEGKDEYCSTRPAMNVNECMLINKIMTEFHYNVPFNLERDLATRIRRDYIWHNDEIPYEAKAKCRRGHSYYSNDLNANDTDIDVGSDVKSLLDYPDTNICFYCVCSVSGDGAGCITRAPWFCEYFRYIRQNTSMRDMYAEKFQQDRPSYFRTLSYRLRRTMDEGMFELIANVGTDDETKNCVPFVSRYSDCTEANQCTGCTRCSCNAEGNWDCREVRECPVDTSPVDEITLNNALDVLYSELKNKHNSKPEKYKPPKSKSSEDLLLENNDEIEQKIVLLLSRQKRSVGSSTDNTKTNKTVVFYNTVDELNEDTLKNSNHSGTIMISKVEPVRLPLILSRRSGVIVANNASDSPLEVFSPAQLYSQQLTDNKIDQVTESEDRQETISKQREMGIVANHTQGEKNRELSKLIVNELKVGNVEVIGDISAPVMSNITFRPENDTLTAMAFIAGNLLNKLWSMEKESSDESAETEALKQEKISDLLELFKEPLSFRQEAFLKSALQTLSDALNKKKDISNVSLCETIHEAKRILADASNGPWERQKLKKSDLEFENKSLNFDGQRKSETGKIVDTEKQKNSTLEAMGKINDVLGMIKKFEDINKRLSDLKGQANKQIKQNNSRSFINKRPPRVKLLTDYEHESKSLFGDILEKVTKLLLPGKRSKKIISKIKKQNLFADPEDVKKRFRESFKYDLGNITLTAKDKLLLDYLTKVKSNPKSVLDDILDTDEQDSPVNIESDILLNLSQFFKIKSYVDLLKLIGPDKKDAKIPRTILRAEKRSDDAVETTKIPVEVTKTNEQISKNVQISTTTTTEDPYKFKTTKEKLKLHLKSILEDLVELQRQNGIPTKEGKIRIADALPCIYKILNADENFNKININDKSHATPVHKMAAILDTLKKELKETSLTRRTIDTDNRPKSAALWERVVKDIDENEKKKSRRNMNAVEPKSYKQLREMIDDVESQCNVYKNQAMFRNVIQADRLVLLKTLLVNVEKHLKVLRNIKTSLEILDKLPSEMRTDITEFVNNAANSLKLDEKVLRHLAKPASSTKAPMLQKSEAIIMQGSSYVNRQSSSTKFSKDDILNQLIKNRVKLYLKSKEDRGQDGGDMNYNIAKHILHSLDNGNYQLARELYKVFVNSKQKSLDNITTNRAPAPVPARPEPSGWSIYEKEPLIQFEDSKTLQQLQRQDQMLKQLLALKKLDLH